jgi:pyridoxamine 5'-phosphate oxidase
MNVSHNRKEYSIMSLDTNTMHASPIDQFREWFTEAEKSQVSDPNAMVLATSDISGFPSARVLLLKAFDDRGFTFFTNYESRKGRELNINNKGALVFYWAGLERQIRIEGIIDKISKEESDAYFETRPKGSRLAAWASPQSEPVENREWLDAQMDVFSKKFSQTDILRPENWGGYRLSPSKIEFWQGRPDRFHDRIRYELRGNEWIINRLAP